MSHSLESGATVMQTVTSTYLGTSADMTLQPPSQPFHLGATMMQIVTSPGAHMALQAPMQTVTSSDLGTSACRSAADMAKHRGMVQLPMSRRR